MTWRSWRRTKPSRAMRWRSWRRSASVGQGLDARDMALGCPVYLFFSVNYAERHFGSWVQDGK